MRKTNMQVAVIFLATALAMPLTAATIVNHFDSPEEIGKFNPQLKDPAAIF